MSDRYRLVLSLAIVTVAVTTAAAAGPSGAAGGTPDPIVVQVRGSSLANIATSPLALAPAFSASTTDYVLRCGPGANTVEVTLTAESGGRLEVGSQSGATVSVRATLVENQALVVDALDVPTGVTRAYWIRCLPHDFPRLQVTKPGSPPPGWYLTGELGTGDTYAIVLDQNATPVWYQKTARPGAINVDSFARNTISWTSSSGPGFGTDPSAAFSVYDLETGTTQRLRSPTPPLDFHELQPLANGDRLMLASPLRAGMDLRPLGLGANRTIVDCMIQQVSPTGRLIWRWRASEHIGSGESLHWYSYTVDRQQAYDVYHCNSIDADSATGDLLLSVRGTDAIYRIDRRSGSIRWKLGGNSVALDGEPHLKIRNDPEGTFHGQHDARFRPNNGVSLYDNHTWFLGAARGVEYRVDVRARTATLVWQYRSPDGRHSAATGAFRRYENGNDNLVTWGIKPNSLFTEVDAGGNVLLDVAFPDGQAPYRVVKVPAAQLDVDLLRRTAGLPAAPFAPRPVVRSVGPAVGRSTGGTTVTVRGTGLSGATAVRFGSVSARSFTVVGDDTITAVAPSGSRAADVAVATAGGTSALHPANMLSRSDATFTTGTGSWTRNVNSKLALARAPARSRPFSLEVQPRKPGLCSVYSTGYPIPSGARISGGVWVRSVLGRGLFRAALIFNDAEGSGLAVAHGRFVQVSRRWTHLSVRGTSPRSSASVALTVDSAGGRGAFYVDDASLRGSARFAFRNLPPEVTSVTPSVGAARGGTSVTITGAGFTAATGVKFGSKPARSFTVSSDDSITAVAPPGVGAVEVTVTTPAGTSSGRERNLLSVADSRFEGGVGLWEGTTNAPVSLSSTRSRTGKHSLEVRPTGDGFASVSTAPYPAGVSGQYDAELWVATPGAREHVRPFMIFLGSSGQILSTEEAAQLRRTSRSGWTKLVLRALSPAGATSVALGLSFAGGAVRLYVDDVRLTSFVRFGYE
jgi:hypothetical protein